MIRYDSIVRATPIHFWKLWLAAKEREGKYSGMLDVRYHQNKERITSRMQAVHILRGWSWQVLCAAGLSSLLLLAFMARLPWAGLLVLLTFSMLAFIPNIRSVYGYLGNLTLVMSLALLLMICGRKIAWLRIHSTGFEVGSNLPPLFGHVLLFCAPFVLRRSYRFALGGHFEADLLYDDRFSSARHDIYGTALPQNRSVRVP